jgi:hypothetical protein
MKSLHRSQGHQNLKSYIRIDLHHNLLISITDRDVNSISVDMCMHRHRPTSATMLRTAPMPSRATRCRIQHTTAEGQAMGRTLAGCGCAERDN